MNISYRYRKPLETLRQYVSGNNIGGDSYINSFLYNNEFYKIIYPDETIEVNLYNEEYDVYYNLLLFSDYGVLNRINENDTHNLEIIQGLTKEQPEIQFEYGGNNIYTITNNFENTNADDNEPFFYKKEAFILLFLPCFRFSKISSITDLTNVILEYLVKLETEHSYITQKFIDLIQPLNIASNFNNFDITGKTLTDDKIREYYYANMKLAGFDDLLPFINVHMKKIDDKTLYTVYKAFSISHYNENHELITDEYPIETTYSLIYSNKIEDEKYNDWHKNLITENNIIYNVFPINLLLNFSLTEGSEIVLILHCLLKNQHNYEYIDSFYMCFTTKKSSGGDGGDAYEITTNNNIYDISDHSTSNFRSSDNNYMLTVTVNSDAMPVGKPGFCVNSYPTSFNVGYFSNMVVGGPEPSVMYAILLLSPEFNNTITLTNINDYSCKITGEPVNDFNYLTTSCIEQTFDSSNALVSLCIEDISEQKYYFIIPRNAAFTNDYDDENNVAYIVPQSNYESSKSYNTYCQLNSNYPMVFVRNNNYQVVSDVINGDRIIDLSGNYTYENNGEGVILLNYDYHIFYHLQDSISGNNYIKKIPENHRFNFTNNLYSDNNKPCIQLLPKNTPLVVSFTSANQSINKADNNITSYSTLTLDGEQYSNQTFADYDFVIISNETMFTYSISISKSTTNEETGEQTTSYYIYSEDWLTRDDSQIYCYNPTSTDSENKKTTINPFETILVYNVDRLTYNLQHN